jgi:uncharacterized membrane protein YcjF (UPF0283 family)
MSDDLSPETNRRLTEELRDAVGRDDVAVPSRAPASRRAALNQPVLLFGALVLVAVGVIASVATDAWIFVIVALVVALVGVGVMVTAVLRLTRDVERPSAELAAALAEEGVADPDRLMSDLVEDASDADRSQGRFTPTQRDPARATVEQRSAMTPSSQPSEPVGPGEDE